jgi:hypothetical protein
MRRILRGAAPGLIAIALVVGGGCGTTPIQVLSEMQGPPGSMDAGVEGRVDASGVESGPDAPALPPDALSPGTAQEYCKGSGPPELVMTTDAGTATTCPDQLAQRAFRYALCVCENYVSDHALITDAFDGAQGPYDPSTATAGGSVGVNGDFHPGLLQIGGSVWASDSTSITTTSPMQINGELHAQGELMPTATVQVQADAWMGGGIYTGGSGPVNVTVGGTLHIPPPPTPDNVSGTFTHGPIDNSAFPYPPPSACDCDSSHFVDVAGVVQYYADPSENDDQALHLDSKMLANVQSALTADLPCGRIYFASIGGNAPVHLKTAAGRVAIFVGGDLSASAFQIDVPTGTELDLFVAGSVTVQGSFLVGDPTNPARARTYVGGNINLQSMATLAGNLYAPKGMFQLGGAASTTIFGSIFASTVSLGSDLTIHYDKAILTPTFAPTCPTPTSCSSCNDCNGGACNTNTCGPCVESSQCCAPLVCRSGSCVADVIPR